MKNIRLFFSALCVVALSVFNTAMADDVEAPGKVKLKIETKTITLDSAKSLVLSGDGKVTLGVYLMLDAGWKTQLDNENVKSMANQMSFAFFETAAKSTGYTTSDFLQNAADYIAICAQNYTMTTPSGGCGNAKTSDRDGWYASMAWYNPAVYGWPVYAYGGNYDGTGTFPKSTSTKYDWFVFKDGFYEIKLFDIQFILKNYTRSYPVGILDDGVKIDAALAATEVSVTNANSDAFRPKGSNGQLIVARDWTEVGSAYFEFVPGGLFIETGPEVETFEPSF